VNIWGWIFIAPILVLLVLEPAATALMLLLTVVIVAGGIWLLNRVIGPKD
jgi:hypothetical protein